MTIPHTPHLTPPSSSSEQQHSSFSANLLEGFQAISLISQSLHELQEEVRAHSKVITESRTDLSLINDKLTTLSKLIHGNGWGDSMYSVVLDLQTRFNELEKKLRERKEDEQYGEKTNMQWIVMITAIIATLMSSIISTFLPLLLRSQ